MFKGSINGVSRKIVGCFIEFCLAILYCNFVLHGSHRSYPSRRRACFVKKRTTSKNKVGGRDKINLCHMHVYNLRGTLSSHDYMNENGNNVEILCSSIKIKVFGLTLVNAGYFFEEITRGAQTSAPPKIPFIS